MYILSLNKVTVLFILCQILSGGVGCRRLVTVCTVFIQNLMGASRDTSSLWNTVWYPAKMMLYRNGHSINCPGVFGSNTAVGKDSPWASATRNNFAFYCRRKSKQALRDYKKVQIQLENLETSVRDRCKKEFTGQSLSSWVLVASGKLGEPPSTLPLPIPVYLSA